MKLLLFGDARFCYLERRMIEGTKPYRARSSEQKKMESSTTDVVEGVPESIPPVPAFPGRREWFRSLVPAFGTGLVEILRASNNLQRDLGELSRKDK